MPSSIILGCPSSSLWKYSIFRPSPRKENPVASLAGRRRKKMTIRVKSHNPSLIRVGDKVTVDAWYYAGQAQLLQAKANSLKFISEKPYGYVEKPAPAEVEKPAAVEKDEDAPK